MPLSGKRVVITRSAKGSRQWAEQLKAQGATVYNLPTISMGPTHLSPKLESVLRSVGKYDWLVFTSATGVRYFDILLKQLDIEIGKQFPPVAAVGNKTANEARKFGLKVAFQPSVSNSLSLGAELEPIKDKRVLLLRTTIASDDLPKQLTMRGAITTDASIYETELIKKSDPVFQKMVDDGGVDFITFASPSAVEGFCALVDKKHCEKAVALPVVAIGPSTKQALLAAGFFDVHIAKEPSAEGVVNELLRLSAS